ncbi:ABC-three component system protein [Rhizobium leguminosarum]|uniref:ABC-three component system protein n=1 Tax=Rhizobium leguminosarum TaxID=384 RepID=UPI003F960299
MADQSDIAAVLLTNEVAVPKQPPANSAKIQFGKVIPPQQQILIYSPDEWEAFIQEWATGKKPSYSKVVRLAGATDMGIDVAGLTEASGFFGIWDNFQCKHYDASLTPSDALPEIGKMLWHSFQKEFAPPRTYRFMAPKGCGISLQRLLLKPIALRERLFEKWDDWCAGKITSTQTIKLEGDLRTYCEAYDYSTFTYVNPLEVVDEHRLTPYFAARFGGGLTGRPTTESPPSVPADDESRYLHHLFDAYGDNKKTTLAEAEDLGPWPELATHYHRQRESFYHAESLRNFARDTVPPGTYEALQDEVYAGVVDISEGPHPDGLARLTAVAQAATMLPLTENGLISVVKVQDRRGICHQLANVDRLIWKK